MCEYCHGEKPLESEVMSFEVVQWFGDTPAILVNFAAPDSYSDVTDLVVPIKFCPMCGRSLTKRVPDVAYECPKCGDTLKKEGWCNQHGLPAQPRR